MKVLMGGIGFLPNNALSRTSPTAIEATIIKVLVPIGCASLLNAKLEVGAYFFRSEHLCKQAIERGEECCLHVLGRYRNAIE